MLPVLFFFRWKRVFIVLFVFKRVSDRFFPDAGHVLLEAFHPDRFRLTDNDTGLAIEEGSASLVFEFIPQELVLVPEIGFDQKQGTSELKDPFIDVIQGQLLRFSTQCQVKQDGIMTAFPDEDFGPSAQHRYGIMVATCISLSD